jgi:hypothetical protein
VTCFTSRSSRRTGTTFYASQSFTDGLLKSKGESNDAEKTV